MVKHHKRTARSATGKAKKGRKPRRAAAAASKRRTVRKSKKSVSSASSRRKGTRKTKTPGKNSDYNLYMKKALSQVKADHPMVSQSEAFKMAAQQWAHSPDNPKNK